MECKPDFIVVVDISVQTLTAVSYHTQVETPVGGGFKG